ncbi:hypothetical protein HK102_008042, partial [Quaeritorhiza haematococci]
MGGIVKPTTAISNQSAQHTGMIDSSVKNISLALDAEGRICAANKFSSEVLGLEPEGLFLDHVDASSQALIKHALRLTDKFQASLQGSLGHLGKRDDEQNDVWKGAGFPRGFKIPLVGHRVYKCNNGLIKYVNVTPSGVSVDIELYLINMAHRKRQRSKSNETLVGDDVYVDSVGDSPPVPGRETSSPEPELIENILPNNIQFSLDDSSDEEFSKVDCTYHYDQTSENADKLLYCVANVTRLWDQPHHNGLGLGLAGGHGEGKATFGAKTHIVEAIICDNVTEYDRKDYEFRKWLLDQVEQAVIVTDTAGKIMYWNRWATVLYQYEPEEVIGRDIGVVTVSDINEEMSKEIMSNLSAGKSWSGTFFTKRRDQTMFAARVVDTPIKDSKGAIIGICGISSDNTPYEQAMQKLSNLSNHLEEMVKTRTAELSKTNAKLHAEIEGRRRVQAELELLSLVVRKTNTLLVILGPSLAIEWVNESFCRSTGHVSEDLRGTSLLDLIWEDEQLKHDEATSAPSSVSSDRTTGVHGKRSFNSNNAENPKEAQMNREVIHQMLQAKQQVLTNVLLKVKQPSVPASSSAQPWTSGSVEGSRSASPSECCLGKDSPASSSTSASSGGDLAGDGSNCWVMQSPLSPPSSPSAVQGSSNRWCWHSFDATPIFGDAGEIQYYVVVLQDITRQKMVEEETRHANTMKTEFITTMSHELRTPLNGIMGATSSLLCMVEKRIKSISHGTHAEHQDPDDISSPCHHLYEIKDTMSIVMSSSQLLLNLVNNVLDFQKIEAGKMESARTLVDVLKCVTRAVRACQPVASMRNVTIATVYMGGTVRFVSGGRGGTGREGGAGSEASCEGTIKVLDDEREDGWIQLDPLPCQSCNHHLADARTSGVQIYGDASKITQVIINLLGNAIKFSPIDGVVKLNVDFVAVPNVDGITSVTTTSNVSPSSSLLCSVYDQGPGIPKSLRKRLFQRFSQLHQRPKVGQRSSTTSGGTGLGLSICKNLLAYMGGRVWIDEKDTCNSASSHSPSSSKASIKVNETNECFECDMELFRRLALETPESAKIPGNQDASKKCRSKPTFFKGAAFHFTIPTTKAPGHADPAEVVSAEQSAPSPRYSETRHPEPYLTPTTPRGHSNTGNDNTCTVPQQALFSDSASRLHSPSHPQPSSRSKPTQPDKIDVRVAKSASNIEAYHGCANPPTIQRYFTDTSIPRKTRSSNASNNAAQPPHTASSTAPTNTPTTPPTTGGATPCTALSPTPTEAPDQPAPPTMEKTDKIEILITDDDIINRKVLTKVLDNLLKHTNIEYGLTLAEDGREALSAIERKRMHVAFIDVMMPVMNGLEAAEVTVKTWPEPTDRPILI